MQSPTEQTQNGRTESSPRESSQPPAVDWEKYWAEKEKEWEVQDAKVNAAIAEAKRRGVPLHEIIPVN